MGSKGSNKTETTSNQSYTPNPAVAAAGYQALSGAQNAANLPFQMPTAPVAGFSPLQQQAFGQVQGAQGMAQPYFGMGLSNLEDSAHPITSGDVSQYYNPMADSVTNQLQNIFGQQMQQTTGKLTQAAGGVGADRIAVGQGNLANQQGLAAGQTYAGLYQQALQAAQQQKQMQAGAGYGEAQMGPAAQAAYLQGTSALGGAGNQQQALQQQQMNAQYQNQLAQIAYPFQTPQYLAGITGGLAPAMGGSSSGQSTTTTPQPSLLSQIGGVALGGAGIMGSLGMFGGSGGKGGSSPQVGSTYGATDNGSGFGYGSYGGVQVPTYFRRGGRMASGGAAYGDLAAQHFANSSLGNPYAGLSDSGDDNSYAEGGDIGLPPVPESTPPSVDTPSIVPKISMPGGGGHSGLFPGQGINMPTPSSGSSGSSSSSGVGDAIKLATTILPMMMERGGTVNPYDIGQHFDDGGDVDPDFQYDTAGARPADPHFTMGDLASRAGDYYSGKARQVADAFEPDPQSALNVQKYMPSAANIFGEAKAAAPAAPQAPQNPMAPPDEAGLQPPANVPMPQARPDIAGPSRFSPQTPPTSPQAIAQETVYAANKYGIPEDIALRLVRRESGFRNIRGAAGEYGPAQLMPGTARDLGVQDPGNTYENIHGGMRYLRQMYDRYGNWNQAIAAYNAGPNNVDKGRIPASTRAYVADVNGDGKVDVNDLSARARGDSGPQNPYIRGNEDMTLGLHGPQPYPDSLDRDWGQKAARSPWMALVKAGAAMASTTGPIGTAIGHGMAAGAGELDSQRKELRTEQDLNQKADHLYQQAQQHLDKYQRMTPYEDKISEWRETRATQGTALQKNANWMVANGIAPDIETAYKMASSGINQPAIYARMIAAEKANLAKLPEGSGLDEASLEKLARQRVQERFGLAPGRTQGTQEKPQPTQRDLDWVKAHPEDAAKFQERFGVAPT